MRKRYARWCLRLALWLDPSLTIPVPVDDDFFVNVGKLITWVETLPATPGEHKMSEVVERLRLRYPRKSRRELHWAVERVLQERI